MSARQQGRRGKKKMGIVLRFPLRHVRASTTSRAAKAVKHDAVTPLLIARSVPSTADHHSAGMLSRCHHLDTPDEPAPTSAAMASLEGHNSITVRKDRISVMTEPIGPFVLKRKANLSLDGGFLLGHTVHMVENDAEALFKQEFTKRVKAARIATGMKQWQVAEGLGVTQDHYKHWEVSRLMPHHLIGRFCILTRIEPDWLMTGHGQKPLKPMQLVEQEPEPAAKAKPKPKRRNATRAA